MILSIRNDDFTTELMNLINKHSEENLSDTPDFVLAEYIRNCLTAFNLATHRRENFYGRACGSVKSSSYADEMQQTELNEIMGGGV